ncbi:MAG: rhomboid family intramembrane serine protease [Roseburia sp.]|nr:rhomboid family intramembrane serine protease [Roseburia sp.]
MNKLRRQPFVSIILVAVNVFVFLICSFTGDLLYDCGDLSLWGVLGQGQYWRVISSVFLHGDISHLFNNMVILFFLGSMIEKELGHGAYTALFFLSGIGGSLLSLYHKYLSASMVGSIGASGAIFGLDGALLAMVLFLPGYRREVSITRVLLMIVLSLYNGYGVRNIDNAAHLGGLLAGFAVGSVICLIKRKRRKGNYHIEY